MRIASVGALGLVALGGCGNRATDKTGNDLQLDKALAAAKQANRSVCLSFGGDW